MLTSNSLTNLIRSFGRCEQALVQGLISDTRDPFYNLPTELLIYIFDFLHPYDVWSKRLICRRWNDVLSSDNFKRTALNRFDTHDPADSALDPATHASSSHMLALRHTLALRNGRPFSYVNYGDQFAFLPNSHPVAHQLRLKGKNIAYLRGDPKTRDGTTVVIRDLVNGEATPLCGSAREKIMLIELSTDIVAFFTYVGTVYVASLLDMADSLRAVRLPSSTIHATYTDRGTLACLLGGASGMTVFLHDTKTRKSASFSHDRHASCDETEDVHCHAVLVNSDDKLVDVFSVVNLRVGSKVRVDVVRYSFTGERKKRDRLTMFHATKNLAKASIGPVLPTGECGLFQLALSLPKSLHGTLLFDAKSATLKMIDEDVNSTALWKDRLYRSGGANVLVDTARRPAPFDGPRSLRALDDEASKRLSEVKQHDWSVSSHDSLDYEDYTQSHVTGKWHLHSLSSWEGKSHGIHGISAHYAHRPTNAKNFSSTFSSPRWSLAAEEAIGQALEEEQQRQSPLHTIVAMNDTFAVGTCLDTGYIGVMCFDERVSMYEAEATDYWAHAKHYSDKHKPQHPKYEQVGPGLLDLDKS